MPTCKSHAAPGAFDVDTLVHNHILYTSNRQMRYRAAKFCKLETPLQDKSMGDIKQTNVKSRVYLSGLYIFHICGRKSEFF